MRGPSWILLGIPSLVLAGIAPPSSALEFSYSAIVTEVIEDPAGTIEFPGIEVGDRFTGRVWLDDPHAFSFTTDIGVSLSRPPSSSATAEASLSNSSLRAFAGYDELQIDIRLEDPTADFLAAMGPIDTSGFSVSSIVFSEGAFSTIVRSRIEAVTIVPEPGAALVFAVGLVVAASRRGGPRGLVHPCATGSVGLGPRCRTTRTDEPRAPAQ